MTALAARPGTSARPSEASRCPWRWGPGVPGSPGGQLSLPSPLPEVPHVVIWQTAAWMWTVGSGWGVTVKSMFRECSPFLFFTYLNCFLCIHFCYHRLYYINNKKIKAHPCCHPWLCPESRAGSSYLKCPRGIGSSGRNPEALRQSRRPSVKLALNVPAACARSRSELSSLEPPLWCSRIGGVLGALGLGFGLAQWVKDPVLPQLRPRSDPWPGNSMRHRAGKNGKETKNKKLSFQPIRPACSPVQPLPSATTSLHRQLKVATQALVDPSGHNGTIPDATLLPQPRPSWPSPSFSGILGFRSLHSVVLG